MFPELHPCHDIRRRIESCGVMYFDTCSWTMLNLLMFCPNLPITSTSEKYTLHPPPVSIFYHPIATPQLRKQIDLWYCGVLIFGPYLLSSTSCPIQASSIPVNGVFWTHPRGEKLSQFVFRGDTMHARILVCFDRSMLALRRQDNAAQISAWFRSL